MLRRALVSPPVLISLVVILLAATLPLYVSGYVLGRWRQSKDEVAGLVERGVAAVERVLAGELE